MIASSDAFSSRLISRGFILSSRSLPTGVFVVTANSMGIASLFSFGIKRPI